MADGPSLTTKLLEQARREGGWAHQNVLTLVDDLTDEQLRWRPGPHAPAIGFHVWHLARWADFDAAQVSGAPQIWETQGLAAAWGFASGLGKSETGTEMGDDSSEDLILPGKTALLEYTGAAFTRIDNLLDTLAHATVLPSPNLQVDDDRAVSLLCTYLTHDNRHLGMIEALRGLLGLMGSATN
jgi:hypothetical protein